MTKTTPGAMRAAKQIEQYWRENYHETPTEERMAEIIDRETASPEMLEALQELTLLISTMARAYQVEQIEWLMKQPIYRDALGVISAATGEGEKP